MLVLVVRLAHRCREQSFAIKVDIYLVALGTPGTEDVDSRVDPAVIWRYLKRHSSWKLWAGARHGWGRGERGRAGHRGGLGRSARRGTGARRRWRGVWMAVGKYSNNDAKDAKAPCYQGCYQSDLRILR